MSNATIKPATGKQLRYLRTLAQRTGTTFTPPRTSTDASREINRMRRLDRLPVQPGEGDGREGRYGTAPDDEPSREPESTTAHDCEPPRARVTGTVIATHEEDGTQRQLLTIPVGDERLLIDRALTAKDTRLLARLAADEPAGNARLIATMYLADPTRATCRRLTRADLGPAKPDAPQTAAVAWETPLVAGIGTTFRLERVKAGRIAQLRWFEIDTSTGECRTTSLRHVVGTLESYEPGVAMTVAAITAHQDDPGCSVVVLRGELDRLTTSPIVLNRGLREQVQRAVEQNQQTMSEIALRCGRVRNDKRGRHIGETSWLARRIGVLPEAGQPRPTPWVHTDVLALIARDGLGITPSEAELPGSA